MFETDKIVCCNCNLLLYGQYLDCDDEIQEYWNGCIYTLYDGGMFCINCVKRCENEKCDNYVCIEYDFCCDDCNNIVMIETTYNNITKSLPVELVNHILLMV
jgi:hypothetical protein